MPEPRVSIIVAAFNGERFLHEALGSAFAQDYDSFEVVFVDDGSSDGTADIARSFPVRYVYQENGGLPAACNAGLHSPRGLIAFLDDDDVLPPSKPSAGAVPRRAPAGGLRAGPPGVDRRGRRAT